MAVHTKNLPRWQFILIALVLSLLSFPLYHILPNGQMQHSFFVGTDFSYAWLVNHLWQYDFSALQHTHFPHGELGLLQYLWPFSGFFYTGWLIILAQRLLLAALCLHFLHKHLAWWWAAALSWLFILPLSFSQGLELQALVLAFLAFRSRQTHTWLALLALTAAFSFYIRLFPFLLSFSLLLGTVILQLIKNRSNFKVLLWPLLAVGFIIGFWLLLFGQLHSLWFKIPVMLELLKGSPFGTALYPTNNHLFLLLAFTALFYIWWRCASIWELLLFGGAAFLIFKYAFVREGYAHLLVFLKLLIPLSLFFIVASTGRKWFRLIAVGVAFLAFSFNMQQVTGKFRMRLPNLQSLARMEYYFHSQRAQALFEEETTYLRKTRHWPQAEMMSAGATASVFPSDYLYPIINGNAVRASPVAQSYVAYTPWLDSAQAAFFSGSEAPEFLYLHQGWGREPQRQISNQYYHHVAPKTQRAIHSNYQLVMQKNKVALYKRVSSQPEQVPQFWQPEPLLLDGWLPVPPSAEALYLKTQLGLTALGELRNFLYKPPRLQISFKLQGGTVETFDLNILNLENGLLVQPFYLNPAKTDSLVVQEIRISSPQPGFFQFEN